MKYLYSLIKLIILLVLVNIFKEGSLIFFEIIAQIIDPESINRIYDLEMVFRLLTTIGAILGVIIFVKLIWKKDMEYIGFEKKNGLNVFLKGFTIGFILFSSILLILIFLGAVKFKGINSSFSIFYIFLFLIGFIIQSTSEEIVVRGALTKLIFERFGKWISILVPAFYFGFMHINNPGVTGISTLNTFLVGIIFGLLLYHDNIYLPIGFHSAWNFFQGPFYGLNISGIEMPSNVLDFEIINQKLAGGFYGIEASLVTTVLFIALIIYLFIKEKDKAY
ncbi:MAG: CPBP family intramembrane metalloprotease [Tissierellia bacterium]|nr:CPBP family intramembrane metalloprotease [Tissierellia bacterium]